MRKNESGQSLIEFALVLPLLLLLLCGIFDFGRAMYGYLSLNLVAQESARLGSLGAADADIKQFADSHVHIGGNTLNVTITPGQADRKSGDFVTVNLDYPMTYMTPLVSVILPPLDITAQSTIREE